MFDLLLCLCSIASRTMPSLISGPFYHQHPQIPPLHTFLALLAPSGPLMLYYTRCVRQGFKSLTLAVLLLCSTSWARQRFKPLTLAVIMPCYASWARQGFKPLTLAVLLHCSTSWAKQDKSLFSHRMYGVTTQLGRWPTLDYLRVYAFLEPGWWLENGFVRKVQEFQQHPRPPCAEHPPSLY